jgi:hypothetical protein
VHIDEDEQVRGAVAAILAVVALDPPRLGPDRPAPQDLPVLQAIIQPVKTCLRVEVLVRDAASARFRN